MSISLLLNGLLNIFVFVSTHVFLSMEPLLYRRASHDSEIYLKLKLFYGMPEVIKIHHDHGIPWEPKS